MIDLLHDYSLAKRCPFTRAAKIAARIILKAEVGKKLSARDIRWARELSGNPGVTNRLLDQSLSSLRAPIKITRDGFKPQRPLGSPA